MVTARSPGPSLRAARQRAASSSSAVESGPPETASTSAGNLARSEKSAFASAAETGAVSAVRTLLFLGDAALHVGGGLRIFAADLGERGAGGFLLVHGGERLAEPQQRLRRLAAVLELGRDREEGFSRVAVALLLEQALAEPILRVGHQALLRMLPDEVAEGLLGQPVIFVQHIAVGHVVFVLRLRRGRQGRELRIGVARRLRRAWLRSTGGRRHSVEVERRA